MDQERWDLTAARRSDPRGAPGRGRAGEPQAGGAPDGELGIEGVTRRRFKTGTTKRDVGARAAPDLVNRDFSAEGPDELWVADITQVRTGAGWLYLAVVLDAWSRRIGGWAMAPRMPAELVGDALTMANRLSPAGGVGHPSQRSGLAVHVAGVRSAVPGGGRRAVVGLGGRCVRQRDVRELLRDARVRTPRPAAIPDGGRGAARSLQASSRTPTTPADSTRRWVIARRPTSRRSIMRPEANMLRRTGGADALGLSTLAWRPGDRPSERGSDSAAPSAKETQTRSDTINPKN